MIKVFIAALTLFVPFTSIADDHQVADAQASAGMPKGAVQVMHIAAQDPQAYTDYLRANPELFKALGSLASGVCTTQMGQDYMGQMFVWNFYDSVQGAMEAITKYDPYKAPRKLTAMREIKYSGVFKPLKTFDLSPGFERLVRVRVEPQNVPAFVAAATQFEAETQAAGSNVQVAVFAPIAAGTQEVGLLNVRFIAASATDLGASVDAFLAAPVAPDSGYMKMVQLGEMVTDTIEVCQQVFSAD